MWPLFTHTGTVRNTKTRRRYLSQLGKIVYLKTSIYEHDITEFKYIFKSHKIYFTWWHGRGELKLTMYSLSEMIKRQVGNISI